MTLSNVAILGILTIVSLFATITFGVFMNKNKKFFKYHKILAGITAILALVHASFVIFRLY